MKRLEDYRGIVPDEVIGNLRRRAYRLLDRHIVNVNSTAYGGGVAEMLLSVVPLMNDAGVEAGWRVLVGDTGFFKVTKAFHNALQGASIRLTQQKKDLYLAANEAFSQYTHIGGHDAIIIHDPQPLPLVCFYRKRQPWIWRCHIDISNPNPALWDYLKTYILRYDLVVVSHESYQRPDLAVEQRVIHPAIDPLSRKNMELPERDVVRYLERRHIPLDKPLVTQVSRFDVWKDPEGLIEVYKRVREKVDCRLVLAGNLATDDPEGTGLLARARARAGKLVRTGDVIFLLGASDIEINALQRASAVVVQKSLREGFGLTVAEALWKGTPVVASAVGGIPLQLSDGDGGFLVDPKDYDQCADRIAFLVRHPDEAAESARRGKEHVRNDFLTTRLLGHWLAILEELTRPTYYLTSMPVEPEAHTEGESRFGSPAPRPS
jgi:trehalose synthase